MINATLLKEELEKLVERLLSVRRLVKPGVDTVGNANGYGRVLSKNYQTIRNLREENEKVLKDLLYPDI